jgi:uncharacterized membrane protein YeaQ/YmgE (transglycosylase-associated protein family)
MSTRRRLKGEEEMFHLAGQIFFGLITGTLAKLIAPGESSGGVIVTALVGLAGSIIGTLIGHLIFDAEQAAGLAGWSLSIAASLVAVGIYQFAVGNRYDREQDISAQKRAQK